MADGDLDESVPPCLICYKDPPNDPRLVNCPGLHSFCRQCIDDQELRSRGKQKCEYCRWSFVLPPEGAIGLPPATARKALSKGEQCKECYSQSPDSNVGQATCCHESAYLFSSGMDAEGKEDCCSEHRQPLEFFCHTCNEVICVLCTASAVNGHHHKHQTSPKAKETIAKSKTDVVERLADLEQVSSSVKTSARSVAQWQEDLNKNVSEVKEQVRAAGQRVKDCIGQVVDASVRKMLDTIKDTQSVRAKHLEAEEEKLEGRLLQLKNALDVGTRLRDDKLALKSFCGRLQALNTCCTHWKEDAESASKYPPCSTVPLAFQPADSLVKLLAEACQCVGQVVVREASAVLSHLQAHDLCRYGITPGTQASITLQSVDFAGFPMREGGEDIAADWLLLPADIQAESGPTVEILDTEDGLYAIQFTPEVAGHYSLQVMVNGHPMPEQVQFSCIEDQPIQMQKPNTSSYYSSHFNASACHPAIVLRADHRKATCQSSLRPCSVLGTHTMYSEHQWVVRIGPTTQEYRIGITTNSSVNTGSDSEDEKFIGWQSNGLRFDSSQPEGHFPSEVMVWNGSDKVELALFCKQKKLRIRNLVSGQMDKITLPQTTTPFYQYFCLFHEGNSLELFD